MRSLYSKRVFILIAVCLSFSFASLKGQNVKLVDSLVQLLPSHTDSAKVDLLIKIAHHLNNFEPVRTRAYALQAIDLSKEIKYKLGLARGYQQLSLSYFMEENHKEGYLYIEKSKEAYIDANHERYLSGIYAQIAHLLNNQGRYIESLDYYQQGLIISTKYKDNHIRGAVLCGIAHIHSVLGNFSKAFELLEESKPLVVHKPYLIHYYLTLGELYLDVGNPIEGLNAFSKAADVCLELNNLTSLAHTYESIARAHSLIGDYEKAATYYFKIVELNKTIQIEYLDILYHLGLGDLSRLWGNYDDAIDHYQKGEKIAAQNQLQGQLSKIYAGLGMVMLDQQKTKEGRLQIEKALQIAKDIRSLESIIDNFLLLSKTYILDDNYHKAEVVLNEALTYVTKNQHPLFYSSILANLGFVYLKKRQFQKSVESLQIGLDYFEKEKNYTVPQRDFTRYLSEAYEGLHNTPLALHYYKKYSTLNDSIEKALNNREIIQVRTFYETEEKQKQIELLHEKEKNQKESLIKNRLYVLILSLIMILGSVLIWGLFQRYKWKKGKERMILEKEHLVIQKELELTQLRNQWFENISHEFRTPLTLILSPLEAVINNFQKSIPIQSMYKNAQKLLDLVNESLDLTKLESGHMPMIQKPIDINHFLNDIAKRFIPLAEIKNVTYSIHINSDATWLSIDKNKLEKAISNIIRNAFDHISKKGSISIHSKMKDQNAYIIEIKDDGSGIDPKHHTLIFDRFYQVNKANFKGSGIGLSLAKEIISMHSGTIELVSTEGQGALFRIILPIDSQLQISAPQNSLAINSPLEINHISNGSLSLPTVFVVEDNQEVRDYILGLYSKTTNALGFTNAKEALEALQHKDPQLIICDVMMPGLDGYAFTEIMKSDIQYCHIPILLLSAKASYQSKLKGLKIGADDYLSKPFNIEELLTRSHNIIQRNQHLKELFNVKNDPIPIAEITDNKLDQDFLQKAVLIVNQNLEDAEFNVSKFTQDIGMSRSTLYNKLKALTNKNISEFIRALRVQKAIELIKENKENMNEIAYATGYNNRQSFISAFKVEVQKTPSEFKKSILKTTYD